VDMTASDRYRYMIKCYRDTTSVPQAGGQAGRREGGLGTGNYQREWWNQESALSQSLLIEE